MKEWKLSIFNIVDKRIKFYSQNTNLLPPKPKSSFRHLKQGIQEFHRKYVLVPADKAANNVVVVCRLHYINTLKQELKEGNLDCEISVWTAIKHIWRMGWAYNRLLCYQFDSIGFHLCEQRHIVNILSAASNRYNLIMLCRTLSRINIIVVSRVRLNLSTRNPIFRVSDQARPKPGCTVTEDGKRLEISDL